MVTTTRCPLRVQGPSSACWSGPPASNRASRPSGRTTHTCVFTPPPVATAAASQAPSAAQLTATTGSSVSSTIVVPVGTSPGTGRSCTQSRGIPLRSLTKATERQSGDSVGPQLPHAATSCSMPPVVTSADVMRLQPHLEQGELPERIGSQGGPAGVRVGEQTAYDLRPEQPTASRRRIAERLLHPVQVRPLELPDGRHREVALGPVDHLVRHHPAAGPLEYALAAVGQLQLRGDLPGELHHLVVQERHPGLQAPS